MLTELKTLYMKSQVLQWQIAFGLAARRAKLSTSRASEHDAITGLENRLANSGGFPIDVESCDPDAVVRSVKNTARRRTGVGGFEGLALNDALIFTDEYKTYSFFRLARAIVKIARSHLSASQFSLLELGCGAGNLRHFLEVFGVTRYLGIDANPVAFRHSPFIQKAPERYRLLDLQQTIDFDWRFDLVCTFEVLEHIREDKLDLFLRTIRLQMDRSSLFLGTASLIDEYDVHVTVHDRSWWLARFARHGLEPHRNSAQYEAILASNHPFNWNAKSSNVFALTLNSGLAANPSNRIS